MTNITKKHAESFRARLALMIGVFMIRDHWEAAASGPAAQATNDSGPTEARYDSGVITEPSPHSQQHLGATSAVPDHAADLYLSPLRPMIFPAVLPQTLPVPAVTSESSSVELELLCTLPVIQVASGTPSPLPVLPVDSATAFLPSPSR